MEQTLTTDELALTKRQLIVRDSLTFLGLASVTLVLFFVTLFLFRSFTAHRATLATRWLDRGKTDLARGHSAQAVASLQVALDYAPGDRAAELLLAQALGDSGHTEESTNYLTELWETEPGSGLINLRLARLSALHPQEQQQTINYYRAAIYGTWEGDGAQRRREVRLELARYLLTQNDPDAARVELLVASGNTIGDPAVDLTVGGLLEQASDPQDALRLYLRSAKTREGNEPALAAAGRLAYRAGDFRTAEHLLSQAVRLESTARGMTQPGTAPSRTVDMLHNAEQVLALNPATDLPAAERAHRLLLLNELARAQLKTCVPDPANPPPALQAIVTRWSSRDATPNRSALLRSTDRQNETLALSYQTALALSATCSIQRSSGQEALLLLARSAKGSRS